MKAQGLLAVIVVFVLTVSMVAVQGSKVSVSEKPQLELDQTAQWRFLIYLGADNNLDVKAGRFHVPVVEDDFRELMSVGSTDQVVCYVFVDRWTAPANLFKIHEGWMEEMTDFPLNGVEANMGDPCTLRSFVEYSFEATRAEHTVLMFWNHGSPNIICWDDNGPEPGVGDALTHHEVIEALAGYKVDVMGADECLVGQIEVAYEYAVSGLEIDFLLASQTYTGWRGYPYDQVFRELVNDPSMTPRECAIMFVEQVEILLSQRPYMSEVVNSHAAIDLAMTRTLVADFQAVTSLICPEMDDFVQALAMARGRSTFQYGASAIGIVDFRNFVETLMLASPSPEASDMCAHVLEDFDLTVVALQDTQALEGFVNGLGLLFPQHEFTIPSYYADYAFGDEGWIDFLQLFWDVRGPGEAA
ncbi:MAG: hypothetical protein JW880_06690 [Candidatus Thermoplasmatota archaeon]|nr:hypothetical protein [Candidatus Thermoplasmatota archaeon]